MASIAGSQLAYLQARSGVARAGAVRFGFYRYNKYVFLESVSIGAGILAGSLKVHLAINDEPDTATFTLKPGGPVPQAGSLVTIGIGAEPGRLFQGVIVHATHVRRRGNLSPWIDVTCADLSGRLDRHLITRTFPDGPASEIAAAIVQTVPPFTSTHVQGTLNIVRGFTMINEKPTTGLRRLATLIDGHFYLDADADVHLFGPAGETAYTAPLPLTNTRSSLKAFQHRYDYSQIRTHVTVEGARTKPAGLGIAPGVPDFPVADASVLDTGGGWLRLGTAIVQYSGISVAAPAITNEPGTKVTAAAVAGAATLTIESNAFVALSTSKWCKVGDQIIRFSGSTATTLTGIPAPGAYGALAAPIAVGASVTALDMVTFLYSGWTSTPEGVITYTAGALQTTVEEDTDIILVVIDIDAAAEALLAALEGGTGRYEYLISDSTLSKKAASQVAGAELRALSMPLLDAEWETEDMNARPGARQVIALGADDTLAATVMIGAVDLTFPEPFGRPRRVCQGAEAGRVAGVMQMLIDHNAKARP